MSARDHYENFLAEHYTWMFGMPFAEKVAEQRQLLEAMNALPLKRDLAIDLGAGSGFQSVALAGLGFKRVIAVDISPTLLAELNGHAEGRPIETVEADLNSYLECASPEIADIIVCMGDTLTHLGSRAAVERLLAGCAAVLAPGGAFVATYRDLSQAIAGADRFIPVASSEDRILTCFLEYQPDAVAVHDLLYERVDGKWRFHASAYQKLRLPADWVLVELRNAGFGSVARAPAGRLAGVVARKV